MHYVPVSLDYSDLYDIVLFFRGYRDGAGSHEGLARKIALAGREWSLTYCRKEDMTAYMFRFVLPRQFRFVADARFPFRLYLEYARVMSRNRTEMTFEFPR